MSSAYFLLLTSVLLIAAPASFAKQKTGKEKLQKSDLQKDNLKGKVLSINEKAYDVSDNKNDLLNELTKRYNTSGNVTEVNYYSLQGDLTKTIRSVYDDRNRLVAEIDSSVLGYKVALLYTNDDRGNNTILDIVEPGAKIVFRATMRYDGNNNMISRKEYDATKTLKNIITFDYDKKGNMIKQSTFDGDSSLVKTFVQQYDKYGIKTGTTEMGKNGRQIIALNYKYTEYDKEGNWLKLTRYVAESPKLSVVRKIEYYK